MAEHSKGRSIKWSYALLLVLHITTASSAKPSESPVFEIINEQARIDEGIRLPTGSSLPYGNPLAGNSLQNARLHAQNQQAMYDAERKRQHRAQVQRWAQIPHVDSYMQAYHDSQEDHQLAVEQQQTLGSLGLIEKKQANPDAKPITKIRHNNPKSDRMKLRVIPEVMRITKADAVVKPEKSRNHRSYGSVEYHQYLQPKMQYKTIYVSPAPTYDQGVTIKPNGNIGLSGQNEAQGETKLFTEAVASKTQYVYPKQYSQMQSYESAQEIAALNSLLRKNPQEQLSELNTLINIGKNSKGTVKEGLESPIDLYFYMKDPPAQTLLQHYDQNHYEKSPPAYASAYTVDAKDHTPITEETHDVENPNKNSNVQAYGIQTVLATQAPEEELIETTTTKSNNYYKVEVASQTISTGHKPKPNYQYVKGHEADKYQLQYIQPLKYHLQKEAQSEGDESERYLHHNAQHTGVQHLAEDGTGVSAYDDDNLHYAANYEFGYRVRDHHSGNDFGHHEAKSEGRTNGAYHVLLPDGRMQKVRYSAGPEGFHADISYDNLH